MCKATLLRKGLVCSRKEAKPAEHSDRGRDAGQWLAMLTLAKSLLTYLATDHRL